MIKPVTIYATVATLATFLMAASFIFAGIQNINLVIDEAFHPTR